MEPSRRSEAPVAKFSFLETGVGSIKTVMEYIRLLSDNTMISVNSTEKVPELLPFGLEWGRLFAATGTPDLTKCITPSDMENLRRYLSLMNRADVLKVVVTEAKDFAARMSELYLIILEKPISHTEYIRELVKYSFLSLFGCIIPQLKYSTALCFCKFWDHEELPVYKPTYIGMSLFPLAMKQCFKRLRSLDNRRRKVNQVKIFTVLQGFKKGLLPLRPHEIEKSLITHKTNLSKVTQVDEFTKAGIRRIIEGLNVKFTPKMNRVAYIPSKATIESSYSKGGTVGLAQRIISGEDPLPRPPEFLGFVTQEGKVANPEPYYACLNTSKSEMIEVLPSVEEFLNKELQVIPAVILEPLKGRIITKPNAGLYMHLTGLQKGLHAKMRTMSPFTAIGEAVGKDFFLEVAKQWKPDHTLVSGDYSAATDNLKSEVTEAVCDVLFSELLNSDDPKDIMVARLGIKSLVQCKILTKDSILPNDETWKWEYEQLVDLEFDQNNGQLMGNVLSFLVLCLANYACFHLACEDYMGARLKPLGRSIPAVKINGDDILFCAPNAFLASWEARLRDFGFEKSMGKNYYSSSFMIINSQLWVCQFDLNDEHEERVTDIYNVPYVNFGLITSRRKQDCSKDQSVVRQCENWTKDYTDEELPDEIVKFGSSGRRYVQLHQGLPEKISDLVNQIWDKHQKAYHHKFGYLFSRTHPEGIKDTMLFESMVFETFRPLDSSDVFSKGQAFPDYPEHVLQRKQLNIKNVDALTRTSYKDQAEAIKRKHLEEGFDGIESRPPKFVRC